MKKFSTCTAPECSRRVETYVKKQLCNAHYLQQARGKPFTRPRERAIGICKFETCDRAVSSRGLCGGHYQQSIKGYELRELNRGKHAVSRRDDLGRKECSMCREWKGEDDYGRHAGQSDGLQIRCTACYKATYDAESARARSLMRHYRLTVDEYEAMVTAQGGKCATCGTSDNGPRAWAVDHDHACCPGNKSCGKCVRGLLCSSCNQALGLARDNVETLRAMADYLLKSPTRTRQA